MNLKKKSGLQRGLSDIVAKQTAPTPNKSELSRGLIGKFTEPPETLVLEYSSTRVDKGQNVENNEQITQSPRSGTRVPEYQTGVVPDSRYYKKPNDAVDSIDRTLTPAESKVFDHLLRLTVGFNKDRCQVRVSTLCTRTGYRSMKTVRIALFGLESKGIIAKVGRNNDPLGDEYILLNSGTRVLKYSSTPVENTLVLESKTTQHLKTSSKDNFIDDEAAAVRKAFFEVLERATMEITGKAISHTDVEKYVELAEVLTTELKIAAARTTISNVPAFLAEHLRRRLFKKDAAQLEREVESPSGAKETPAMDASKCPDCAGALFWYPNGYEKGVVKCRHEKLKNRE